MKRREVLQLPAALALAPAALPAVIFEAEPAQRVIEVSWLPRGYAYVMCEPEPVAWADVPAEVQTAFTTRKLVGFSLLDPKTSER